LKNTKRIVKTYLKNDDELEDNLKSVKSADGKYNFETFYGSEKIYEIPESIKDDREQSNRIVTKKDKKGGWVYDEVKGTISPNI